MEVGCEENTTWEEEMYWSHFRTIHFSQFLLSGFEEQLAIPEKFANNLKCKLPATVILRGPSGITWNVGLTKIDDMLTLKNGWKLFVHDNSLVENDFLIFKFNGRSQFDVLMFDSRSLCEKESTYFIREHGHVKQVSECQTGRKKDSSIEVIVTSPDDAGYPSSEIVKEDDGLTTPSKQHVASQATKKEVKKKAKSMPTRSSARSTRTTSERVVRAKHDVESSSIKRKVGYAKQYQSNRRPVTEEEKRKALQAAEAAANKESAIAIMRPTSVYRKFFVVIPKEWLTKHVSLQKQDVILRYENKTWNTRFYYDEPRGSGGLTSAGWKNFALENNLEEFDVCVFQPATGSNTPITLDVSIFRVVEEITPLTLLF